MKATAIRQVDGKYTLQPLHPGQLWEITCQLRGEAGDRQHPDARLGLAHMMGVGAVGVVHVLART